MDQGAVKNLEQIQESDSEPRSSRGVTIALVSLGGACVLFAALAFGRGRAGDAPQKVDPLGDLVTQHAKSQVGVATVKPTDLSPRDVTFPQMLSDDGNPTTALAAVKGGTPGKSPITLPVTSATAPPPATDKLPVVPLPAQNILEATPVVTRPRDALTRAASENAQLSGADKQAEPGAPPRAEPKPSGEMAPAGREGGYQLQVSSFRTQAEGDSFANQLRARGHKAYVVEAHVPGRGTWYRVRIGPFPSQHAAAAYRSGFETREHVVPFIVPPNGK
ncbi:MAG: SPOR domain-containing protein [Myxococcales bacterium]|jgi:cell division septation protein DedD|nr:SPOR domain-containing protein [Myxococcales bacterium]